jgi:hypothetical protein
MTFQIAALGRMVPSASFVSQRFCSVFPPNVSDCVSLAEGITPGAYYSSTRLRIDFDSRAEFGAFFAALIALSSPGVTARPENSSKTHIPEPLEHLRIFARVPGSLGPRYADALREALGNLRAAASTHTDALFRVRFEDFYLACEIASTGGIAFNEVAS